MSYKSIYIEKNTKFELKIITKDKYLIITYIDEKLYLKWALIIKNTLFVFFIYTIKSIL